MIENKIQVVTAIHPSPTLTLRDGGILAYFRIKKNGHGGKIPIPLREAIRNAASNGSREIIFLIDQ